MFCTKSPFLQIMKHGNVFGKIKMSKTNAGISIKYQKSIRLFTDLQCYLQKENVGCHSFSRLFNHFHRKTTFVVTVIYDPAMLCTDVKGSLSQSFTALQSFSQKNNIHCQEDGGTCINLYNGRKTDKTKQNTTFPHHEICMVWN